LGSKFWRTLWQMPEHRLRRRELRAALREVMLTGTDCAPADDPASFYRSQLHSCIGTAARAIGEEAT
jgi:hypothetical protein